MSGDTERDTHVGSQGEAPAGGEAQAGEAPAGAEGLWLSRLARTVLVVVILGAGALLAWYWMNNRPTAERRKPAPEARLVEAQAVSLETHRVVVRAMGTVVPAQEIDLAARVSGTVVELSSEFVPGGHFAAGEPILQIDPTDYEIVVRQRQSELAKAQADLRVEEGRQDVARQEYELLGKKVEEADQDLVLRGPQLEMARAAVASAEAALERARLDADRSKVAAPFAATVHDRTVNLGAQVAVGAPLATLCGTDTYWVRVLVPVSELAWITIPGFNAQAGSPARLYDQAAWGAKAYREGRVVRLMSELEPQGRMAMLLVAVDDPLDLKRPPEQRRPLILDSYIRVEIDGREVQGVCRVARTALRDGDKVWVMAAGGTLDIRPVTIVWSDAESVFVSDGLRDGDRLVTSDLGAPVQGMPLRTAEAAALAAPEASGKPAEQVASDGGPAASNEEARP